jgi:hypothetical protein
VLQLLPEDLVVFPGFAQLSIPLGELVGELLQLFAGLVGRCGPLLRLGQQGLVEACGPGRLAIPAVGEGQPAQHMEQLTGDQRGGGHTHRLSAMHGLVPPVLDELEAAQRLLANEITELVGMHHLRQARFSPGPLQLSVVLVDPLHQPLERAAGVEAGGTGIGESALLNHHGLTMQFRSGRRCRRRWSRPCRRW